MLPRQEFEPVFWEDKINLRLEYNYAQIAAGLVKYVKQIIPLRKIKWLT